MPRAETGLRPGLLLAARRELRRIARRPALMLYVLVFPLLIFLLLAAAFGNGVATDLPIGVLDLDRSSLSRQIVQKLDAAPEIAVAQRPVDMGDAQRMMRSGLIYGVVLLPAELERDMRAGRGPELTLLYNNQFMTPGSTVARSVQSVLTTVTAEISVASRMAQGQAKALATAAVNPIPLQSSPLFNPTLDYVQFLLAALMPAVLQIFICAITAYVVVLERQRAGGLRTMARLGHGLLPALLGKMAPYTVIFATVMALGDALLFYGHGVPFRGSMPVYLAGGLVFILAYQLVGIAIGLAAPSASTALGTAGIFTAPAFGFIGVSFPRLAMEGFASLWGNVLPLTWYMDLRVDQMLRGATADESRIAFGILAGLALAYGLVALLLVLKTRPRTDRKILGGAQDEVLA